MKSKKEIKTRIKTYTRALKHWETKGENHSRETYERVIARLHVRIEELKWVLS